MSFSASLATWTASEQWRPPLWEYNNKCTFIHYRYSQSTSTFSAWCKTEKFQKIRIRNSVYSITSTMDKCTVSMPKHTPQVLPQHKLWGSVLIATITPPHSTSVLHYVHTHTRTIVSPWASFWEVSWTRKSTTLLASTVERGDEGGACMIVLTTGTKTSHKVSLLPLQWRTYVQTAGMRTSIQEHFMSYLQVLAESQCTHYAHILCVALQLPRNIHTWVYSELPLTRQTFLKVTTSNTNIIVLIIIYVVNLPNSLTHDTFWNELWPIN